MAMADLASHSGNGPVPLTAIAERQEISHSYLEQLFARLRRAGVVRSVRGPGGGYQLAHPAGETRVADVVLAVDEPLRATRCDPNTPKGCLTGARRCLTHDLWDELSRQIHLFLSGVTLEDVVKGQVRGRAQAPSLQDTPRFANDAGQTREAADPLADLGGARAKANREAASP